MTVNKTIILNGQQELNLDTVYTRDDRQTLHAVEVVALQTVGEDGNRQTELSGGRRRGF